MEKLKPTDFFNTILQKQNIPDELELADYNPFIMNRFFSQYPDLIWFAQELNMNHQIPKEMQFWFYFYGIEKIKKKFSYAKKTAIDPLELEKIEILKELYNYSTIRAKESIPIIDAIPALWDELKASLNKGGLKSNK